MTLKPSMMILRCFCVAIIAIATANAAERQGSAIQRVIPRTQSAPPTFAGSSQGSPRVSGIGQDDNLSETSSCYSDARSEPDTEEQESQHGELLTPPRSPPSAPSPTRSDQHAHTSSVKEWPSLVPHAIESPQKHVPARQTTASVLDNDGDITFTRPPYGWPDGEENENLASLTLAQRYNKLSARLILFENDLRFLKSFTEDYDEQDVSPKMKAPLAYVETFPVGRRYREYVRTYVADGTHIDGHLVWILAHATNHLTRDALRSKAKLLKRKYPELIRRIDNKSFFDIDEADAIGRYGEDSEHEPGSPKQARSPMHSSSPRFAHSPLHLDHPAEHSERHITGEEEQVKEIDGPIKPSKDYVSLEVPPLADMIKFFPPLRGTAIHVDNNGIPWLGQPSRASPDLPKEYKAPSRVSLPVQSGLNSSVSPGAPDRTSMRPASEHGGEAVRSLRPGEPSTAGDDSLVQTDQASLRDAPEVTTSSDAEHRPRQHLTEKEWWDEWHYKTSAMKRIEEYLFLFPDYLRQYKEKKIERRRYLPLRSSGPMIIPGLLQSEWFIGEDRLPKQYLFANLFIDGTPIWVNVLSDCPPWRRDDREKRMEKLCAKYPHIATTLRHIHDQACQRKDYSFHPSWRTKARESMMAQASDPASATRALADYRYSKSKPKTQHPHTAPLTSSVYLPRWPARTSSSASSSISALPVDSSQAQDTGVKSERNAGKGETETQLKDSPRARPDKQEEDTAMRLEKRATLEPSRGAGPTPVVTYLQIGSRWFAYPSDRKTSPERVGTGVYFNPTVTQEAEDGDDDQRKGILGKAPVETPKPSIEVDHSDTKVASSSSDNNGVVSGDKTRDDAMLEEQARKKAAKEAANEEKLKARRKKLAVLAAIPENEQLLASLEACGAFVSPPGNFAEALKTGHRERKQAREDIWREMRRIYGIDRQQEYWKQAEERCRSKSAANTPAPSSKSPGFSEAISGNSLDTSVPYTSSLVSSGLSKSLSKSADPSALKKGVLSPDSPPFVPSRNAPSPDSPPFMLGSPPVTRFSPTGSESSMTKAFWKYQKMHSHQPEIRPDSGSPVSPASDGSRSPAKSPLDIWHGPKSKTAADFYKEAVEAAQHTELSPVSPDATPGITNAKLAWRPRRKSAQQRRAKVTAASMQPASDDDNQRPNPIGDALPVDPFHQARVEAMSRGLDKYRDAFAPRKSDEPLLRAKTPSAIY